MFLPEEAPPEAVPIEVRIVLPAERKPSAERAFVCALAGEVFEHLGRYDAILGGWFDHPGVTTSLAWVAEGDEEPVGFVMWAFIDPEPDGPTRPVADVIALAVVPQWRRRGIGRALLRWALAQIDALAPAAGVRRVELSVAEGNSAAAALFQSEGFGRRPRADVTYPGGQACLRLGRPVASPRG